MITTTVDRIIALLTEKESADIKQIAKTLGTKVDSVDAIISYLEEEGMVELQYGVLTTIAKLKKEEKKEGEEKKLVKKVGGEEKAVPKPTIVKKPEAVRRIEKPVPKPAEKPEAQKPLEAKPVELKPTIPRLNETKGTKAEKSSARLANMMISLLEKFKSLPKERQFGIVPALNDVLRLAKDKNLYARKDAVSSEFILCSLIISLNLIIDKYAKTKDAELAKKADLTYQLIEDISAKADKARLQHYNDMIENTHQRIVDEVYPISKLRQAIIDFLSQKKKFKVKKIPKAVNSTKEKVGPVLDILKKEGAVEVKKGMFGAKAIFKKLKVVEEKKLESEIPNSRNKVSRKPELKKEFKPMAKAKIPEKAEEKPREFPKPLEIEKPEIKPQKPKEEKQGMVPAKPLPKKIRLNAIPRFNEAKGGKADRMNAKLANMMIDLLEKFHNLEEENHDEAVLLLNRMLTLAKENNLYARKDEISAEFILCSLLISMDILVSEYEATKDAKLAKKLHSTYQLMKGMALKIDKKRLKYYNSLIKDIHGRIVSHVYSKTDIQKIKTTV